MKFTNVFIFLSSGRKVRSQHPASPKVVSSQEHLACLQVDSPFGGTPLSWKVMVGEGKGVSQVGGANPAAHFEFQGSDLALISALQGASTVGQSTGVKCLL